MPEPIKDTFHSDSIGAHVEKMCRTPSELSKFEHIYDRLTPQGSAELNVSVIISLNPTITAKIDEFIRNELMGG